MWPRSESTTHPPRTRARAADALPLVPRTTGWTLTWSATAIRLFGRLAAPVVVDFVDELLGRTRSSRAGWPSPRLTLPPRTLAHSTGTSTRAPESAYPARGSNITVGYFCSAPKPLPYGFTTKACTPRDLFCAARRRALRAARSAAELSTASFRPASSRSAPAGRGHPVDLGLSPCPTAACTPSSCRRE